MFFMPITNITIIKFSMWTFHRLENIFNFIRR